ncbi:hypothetical protein J6590_060934 [Homalodisca vitripennis]|nr:hypothetical protein J6590_060934 [Homalodisca vitripennis]
MLLVRSVVTRSGRQLAISSGLLFHPRSPRTAPSCPALLIEGVHGSPTDGMVPLRYCGHQGQEQSSLSHRRRPFSGRRFRLSRADDSDFQPHPSTMIGHPARGTTSWKVSRPSLHPHRIVGTRLERGSSSTRAAERFPAETDMPTGQDDVSWIGIYEQAERIPCCG